MRKCLFKSLTSPLCHQAIVHSRHRMLARLTHPQLDSSSLPYKLANDLNRSLSIAMKMAGRSAIFVIISICAASSLALKCRSDDGLSDEHLKRIARSCMRKIGENVGHYHQNQSDGYFNNFSGQDSNEYNWDERFRQGSRDRLQLRSGRSKRSGNDRRYDFSSNGGRNQNQNQNQNQRSNNNNHYGSGNSNNNNSYGDRQNRDMQRSQDGACVVHCFFEELNMLNNDDYPDKHKVKYILTKDIRDRELKSFYSDTIQECFHYLDMQRRKDRCQFSKELINCMMEYARANCEDWQDHTLIFS